MSDQETPDDGRIMTACHACDGTGYIIEGKAAIIEGVPQTRMASRRCRWCSDEHPGALRGLTPPE